MNTNKQAILTVGPSSCGKSSWAHQFLEGKKRVPEGGSWRHLERDEIRFKMYTGGLRDWTKYNFKNEKSVSEQYDHLLDSFMRNEENLLLCDTWLNPKYRNAMVAKLMKAGYLVEFKDDWEFTWDDLVKRNNQRLGGVGVEILWDQYQRWLDYKQVKRYECVDSKLSKAVICDIDGTIADHQSVRGPFEFNKVGLDKPIWLVINMVRGLADAGYKIILFSGRSDICRPETEKWLKDHIGHTFGNYDLFMRKEGDNRRDSIIKEEMFWEHAAPYWNVVASVDDRNNVLRETWSKLGIKCVHVGHMYEEF